MQQSEKDSQPSGQQMEPPPSIPEVDSPIDLEHSDHSLPEEVMYMLRSVRVLGHFEKPIFLELCRFMESRFVPAGSFLFNIGDHDDSIYVVQSGKINILISEANGQELSIKQVAKGQSIHSLLSIMDALMGHGSYYKTVSAVAAVDSTIIRLPVKAFQIMLERFPESLVRVVQIIMVRLQRVMFMALHNYLGLSSELINPENQSDKPFSDSSITHSTEGSHVKISSTDQSSAPTRHLDDTGIMKLALKVLTKLFGLKDDGLLVECCFLRYIKAGQTLVKQGDEDASLYFVVTGKLDVQQIVVGSDKERHERRTLFVVHPGEVVGSLAVLTGEPSFFTIRSMSETRVVTISKQHFYEIVKENPRIVLNVGHTVVKRMSLFVRQIDFALDWSQIEAGRALYRQDEHSDCIYIILNGRLRSVLTLQNDKKELVGEYGRGELVGTVEVLTQTARATTLMAVREAEVVQIPGDLLNVINRKYPQILARLVHLLGNQILGSLEDRHNMVSPLSEHPNMDPRPLVAKLATVAILAVSDDVPLDSFTLELQHSLTAIGPTLHLTSEIIKEKMGATAFNSANEYRLSSWLGQQEDIHRMVLYQCDKKMTPWTQRCIRQADCILIVAMASQEPIVGEVEHQMDNLAVRAQKELILLHTEDGPRPKNTVEWLNLRDWCSSHHHIRCNKRVLFEYSPEQQREVYSKLLETPPDRMSDLSRLARFLTGTSVGLVLGGGGARGLSHVGMIRAIQEAGVPIDMIGGTSIGSFMGALWAEERNITRFTERAREWSKAMSSKADKIFDMTYPVIATFKGSAFNKGITDVFQDRQIEDLWIPYFSITTDITASKMRVHTRGSLWRYVRASMSLSGYLPPLCDPVDGHLLLDGGYVNNLPADVMKSLGAQTIFAVDVGSQDDTDLEFYGDELSGWRILAHKLKPWGKNMKVPDLAEIRNRLAYVSCARQLELVRNSDYCEYIRPPIDKYNTLQFTSFDEIHDVGYGHGRTVFEAWEKSGVLSRLLNKNSSKTLEAADKKSIELADMISHIDCMPSHNSVDTSDDDNENENNNNIPVISEPEIQTTEEMENLQMLLTAGDSQESSSDEFHDSVDFDDAMNNKAITIKGRSIGEDGHVVPGSPPIEAS